MDRHHRRDMTVRKRYQTTVLATISIWSIIHWLQIITGINAVLHSKFLQPGNGIIKETWFKANELNLDTHRSLQDYPTCPHLVQNLNDFNDAPSYISSDQKHVFVRYKGYFIPSETGNHQFYAKCKEMCSLKIEAKVSEMRKILEVTYGTPSNCWDCIASQKSRYIHLYKSVRYYIEMIRVGTGNYNFAAIGVKRPSGIYERPIRKTSLWRTLSLYYWHGLLGEFYNIVGGTRPELGTLASEPTEVKCLDKTYDNRKRYNFAIRSTGFFHPEGTGNYDVFLYCKNRCVFYLTVNGTERKIAEQDDTSIFQNMSQLKKDHQYFIRINYYRDWKGGTSFSVKRRKELTVFDYFKSTETRTINLVEEIIPEASYTVVNSTSVNISWNVPQIPLHNNFTFKFFKIRFWPLVNSSDIHESIYINKTVLSNVFYGLGIWTLHLAEIWYAGKEYTVKPKDLVFRTGEDVPSAPPSRIYLEVSSSTSIVVRWASIPFEKQHGVVTGYIIKYRKRGDNHWKNVSSNIMHIREKKVTGLEMYSEYQIRVAGKTSVGVGVFSADFMERTMEDAPSTGPTDITAYNLSSTALNVSWGLVPQAYRNGIIRTYVIYYKLKDSPESSWNYVKASANEKSKIIPRLKHWSFYEIKIAAKTINEGEKSDAVIARTDEYVPSGPPINVTGIATSSMNMTISWHEIPFEFTNGVIVNYWITYKETEGYSRWVDTYSIKMHANVIGLEENFNYTVQVAGMTTKGVGVFSNKIYVKTQQDVPSAPPDAIGIRNTSANSLLVSWQKIPYRQQNGIIIGYKVAYKVNETLEWGEKVAVGGQMQAEIFDLKNYTWYEIKVAGITAIGVGRFNVPYLGITDENVPSAPPSNFSGNNVTSRSIIVFWDPIPLKKQNGVIVGFKVEFQEVSEREEAWMETYFDANAHNGTVSDLKMFQPYYLRIAGVTSKGVGVFSDVIKVWTDEDSPDGYPMNVNGSASSSTALSLSWERQQTNDSNGIVLGYKIFYQVVKCPEDRPNWCSESTVKSTQTKNDTGHFVLKGLEEFMEYFVWIRVLNKIGTGPPSPKFKIKTATGIPAGAPLLVESFSRDIKSIHLFWDPIKESMRNGIIIHYRVFYRRKDSEVLRPHRVERAIANTENNTIEGLLPGESYIDVNGSHVSVVLENLEPYRWYIIRIGGMTKAGLGPVSVINASCGQDVAVAAPLVRIHDRYSYNEITIDWSAIRSFNQTRGTVLEYRVRYMMVEFEMLPVAASKVMSFLVNAPLTTTKLRNLKPFGMYAIEVAAVTQMGVGIYSHAQYGETCRCDKEIQIVKRVLHPLITASINDTLTLFIDSAIKSCCSSCAGVNPKTIWETDSHGTGVISADDIFEEIQHGKEVYIPQLQHVHTWWHLDTAHGVGKFVPVIRSPGVAVIARRVSIKKKANDGARTLINGLVRAYPVFFLSMLLIVLFGFFQWFVDLNSNRSFFAGGLFLGMSKAIWFSVQTQSSVGNGDMFPVTFLGRFGAITSAIFGIIWRTLLVASIIVTILINATDETNASALKGKKVAVTNGTHLLGLQKGGSVVKVVGYKDYREAVNAVLNGNSEMALIDGLSIVTDGSITKHEELIISDIIDRNQYYGIVVSGKAEKLANCINIEMRSKKKEIERALDIDFYRLWEIMKNHKQNEKAANVLSKDSTAFKTTVTTAVALLVMAIVCGFIYEQRRRKTLFLRVGPKISLLNKHDHEELIELVESFVADIKQTTEQLDLKHAKQRLYLSEKRYAVNIVPDVIDLFGNADYEEDIKRYHQSIGMKLLGSSSNDVKLPRDTEKEQEVCETKEGVLAGAENR